MRAQKCDVGEGKEGDFPTVGPSMVVVGAQMDLDFEQLFQLLQLGSRSAGGENGYRGQ